MLNYSVKIGLCPIRRDCTPREGTFNWERAEERCYAAVSYVKEHFASEQVSFVDLEGINSVSVLFHESDVPKVVERFRQEKVDAVFFIAGNFGNEEVVGMVAEELGKPVLLWGPQDDVFEPDGMRYTDTQCGLFGISRQLQRLNVPFSYIENCYITDRIFTEGLERFCRVVCMVKNFKGMRVLQVGTRPKPFCSVIVNEGELMQRFGIKIIPVNMAIVLDRYRRILEERQEELEEGAKLIESRYEVAGADAELLKKMYAFVPLYKDLARDYQADVISSECWTSMELGMGAVPCTAYSILADMGYIMGCESDIHGTITMALLSCASMGQKVPYFGEFTNRHPSDRNVEMLWHCGQFAYSLKKEGCPCKNVDMYEWFEVKEGSYTIARMDQEDGDYRLLNGTFESADGPYTFGTYIWARFDNLDKWERKLIEGPYIHHMAEIEGDYTAELREFCKYIKYLSIDTVE